MFQQVTESEGVQPNHNNNMPYSSSEEPIHPLPSNLRERPQQQEEEQESGGVQPNINPSLQPNHESGGVNPSLQPNHESGGVQPNVNPSLQPNHESGGVQPKHMSTFDFYFNNFEPNHDGGGSANPPDQLQPDHDSGGSVNPPDQLSKPDSTTGRLSTYGPLVNAAQEGDWKTARKFIDDDPNVLTLQISSIYGTVLHIAARSCQWEFIQRLLELDVLTPQSIAVRDSDGSTVLHEVAQGGSSKTAKALVEKSSDLLQIENNEGELPLYYSTYCRSKELAWYLSLETSVESPIFPFYIPALVKIFKSLIRSGYYDIALFFVVRFTHLALAKDEHGESLLFWLADNPSYFFSGSNFRFLEGWIYKFVHVEIKSIYSLASQSRSSTTQETVLGWFKRLLWKAITQLAPSIKIVRDAKMQHACAIELVNEVVKQIERSTMSNSQICHFLQNPISIMGLATEGGIEEIVRTLLRHFPDLSFLWVRSQRNILQAAIEYRQEKIVNIIKDISPTTTIAMCSNIRENKNTTLHLAGKLAPAFKLFSISGAALQMQRELQWFEEVEMYTLPADRKLKNSEHESAKDVFRKEHKELAEQGEKWMKDTANYCMLVATLIATVLFAAVFTVPGGNDNDKGIPIFLQMSAFTIFIISDALGLLSALTSLLMFLSILTARYAMEDFLKSLPKRLIIGLGSLFFAIAAMITAFGAALTIILTERWYWVSLPVTLMASFPVAVFVMLQLPLFVQMVQSTYGSIFRHWPSEKFE